MVYECILVYDKVETAQRGQKLLGPKENGWLCVSARQELAGLRAKKIIVVDEPWIRSDLGLARWEQLRADLTARSEVVLYFR